MKGIPSVRKNGSRFPVALLLEEMFLMRCILGDLKVSYKTFLIFLFMEMKT